MMEVVAKVRLERKQIEIERQRGRAKVYGEVFNNVVALKVTFICNRK